MMFQAGPLIRFVCEDHPDIPGCACVAEMVNEHRSARALVDQLKELNLSLQIELGESQRKCNRLRQAVRGVMDLAGNFYADGVCVSTWDIDGILTAFKIDPETLEGGE